MAAALPWPPRTGIGPWRRRRAGLDPCPETELGRGPPPCWTGSAELALTAQTHRYAAPPLDTLPRAQERAAGGSAPGPCPAGTLGSPLLTVGAGLARTEDEAALAPAHLLWPREVQVGRRARHLCKFGEEAGGLAGHLPPPRWPGPGPRTPGLILRPNTRSLPPRLIAGSRRCLQRSRSAALGFLPGARDPDRARGGCRRGGAGRAESAGQETSTLDPSGHLPSLAPSPRPGELCAAAGRAGSEARDLGVRGRGLATPGPTSTRPR